MKMTRSPTSRAKSSSCVTTIMVMPERASSRIVWRTSSTSSGSSAEVGSSNSIRAGSMESARAMATRCCCPPESCDGSLPACSPRPSRSSSEAARARASATGTPSTRCGPMVTFWRAVRLANRLKRWNTKPTRRRLASRTLGGSGRQRRSGPSPVPKGTPSRTMAPRSGNSRHWMQRRSVVFPDPLGPTMMRISPLSTLRDTSFSTTVVPKAFERCSTRRMAIAASPLSSLSEKAGESDEKGPAARPRPRAAREAYSLYVASL